MEFERTETSSNDNDSAFSSECLSNASCSCDSIDCNCQLENPFSSFRHSGPLPYSLFEDSSSFSCSPCIRRHSTMHESDVFDDSTHIYMNLIDASETNIVGNLTRRESFCDGKEELLLQGPEYVNAPCDLDITYKVKSWLEHTFAESFALESAAPNERTIDSDTTEFLKLPLAQGSIAKNLSTPKRRLISKKLKKIGKYLRGGTTCNIRFQTIAMF